MEKNSRFCWEPMLWRFFGLMLIWAGGSKILDPVGFLGVIHSYQLALPDLVARLVAIVLPWFECFCGLLLIAGFWPEMSRWSLVILLGGFTVVTGQAWWRGLELSCGCFELGFLDPRVLRWVESAGFALFRNLVWLGVCFWLMRRELTQSGEAETKG